MTHEFHLTQERQEILPGQWGVGGLFGASSKFHQLSVKGVTCFKYQKFGPWHMTTGQVPPGSDSQAHVFPMGIG